MRERLKRRIASALWLIVMLLAGNGLGGLSEEWIEVPENPSGLYGDCSWDGQYVYITKGVSEDGEINVYYEVMRMDRFTGRQEMLIDNHERISRVIADGRNLYLMYENDAPDGRSGLGEEMVYIVEIDDEGSLGKERQYVLDGKWFDVVLYNHGLYLRTKSNIVCIDLKTWEITNVFASELLKKNVHPDNMMIENGKIYVQEYDNLIGIDLVTGEKEAILEGYLPVLWPVRDDYYDCFVLNGYLYFWDKEAREMAAMNLENKERHSISKDLYLFQQFSADGVIARRVGKVTVDAWLQNTYRSKYVHPRGIWESTPCEYVFIRRDDSAGWLLKNEEDGVQIGYGDQYVLIGNGQYLHFSEDYKGEYVHGRIREVRDLR